MIRLAKHEELYENLKNVLIEQNPGDNFISVREIMRQFDVSQATVSSALVPLLEEKLLEKRNGLGMFVTPEVMKYKACAPPVIVFAIPRWMSMVYLQLENTFLELQQEFGFCGEVIHYDWHDGIICKLPNRKIDGLIVLPAVQTLKAEQIQILNGFNVPYLLLGQNLKAMEVNTVYCDDEFGATLAADHLVKLGHKKMAILITEALSDPINDRIRGFTQYCELQGATVEIIDCEVKSGDDSLIKTYEKVKTLCKTEALNFTGLFVISDEPCMSVFKALHEAGIKIPGEISVISIGSSANSSFYYPALTTVATGLTRQMTECIVNIKKIVAGTAILPVKKCLKAEIIIRESTGKCNH